MINPINTGIHPINNGINHLVVADLVALSTAGLDPTSLVSWMVPATELVGSVNAPWSSYVGFMWHGRPSRNGNLSIMGIYIYIYDMYILLHI